MKEKISNAILTTCVVSNKDTGIPRAVDIIHKMFIEEQIRGLERIKSHKLIGDQILALNKLI